MWYKKGSSSKLVDMLSRSPTPKITTLGTLCTWRLPWCIERWIHGDYFKYFTHDAYKDEYLEDEDFKEVFKQLDGQVHV